MMVSATIDQRVAGGGSLSLIYHVATLLDLEEGDISGDWDFSHNLQLVFSDVLKSNPKVVKLINLVFNTLKQYHLGKSSSFFEERAKE